MPTRRRVLLSVAFASVAGAALAASVDAHEVERATDGLWLLASDSGMDRTTFNRAVANSEPRHWIVSRSMDAEARWNIDATPSFLVNGKLHTGAMTAAELSTILAS